jgi:hypothetical protein
MNREKMGPNGGQNVTARPDPVLIFDRFWRGATAQRSRAQIAEDGDRTSVRAPKASAEMDL